MELVLSVPTANTVKERKVSVDRWQAALHSAHLSYNFPVSVLYFKIKYLYNSLQPAVREPLWVTGLRDN
jgi:hypothetical protein